MSPLNSRQVFYASHRNVSHVSQNQHDLAKYCIIITLPPFFTFPTWAKSKVWEFCFYPYLPALM